MKIQIVDLFVVIYKTQKKRQRTIFVYLQMSIFSSSFVRLFALITCWFVRSFVCVLFCYCVVNQHLCTTRLLSFLLSALFCISSISYLLSNQIFTRLYQSYIHFLYYSLLNFWSFKTLFNPFSSMQTFAFFCVCFCFCCWCLFDGFNPDTYAVLVTCIIGHK